MKRLTTSKATPCRKMTISAQGKTFTLALPWSIGQSFTIGHVTFEHNGSVYRPNGPIPESWFIDLAAGGEA